MYRLLANKTGITFVELIIYIAVISVLFAGFTTAFGGAIKAWTINTKRINYVQDQQDTNALFQAIAEKVRFANSVPTINSGNSITYIVNDTTNTNPTPVTYTMYTHPDPNNTSMVVLLQDRITAPATAGQQLIGLSFSSITFQANDPTSIVVRAVKTQGGQEQSMIISCGGFR